MRIVVHGQQAFGKAVLEALLKRGENVVAVYVAPEKEGAKADPLKEAALAAKLPVYQPASYHKPKVWEEFKALKPDLQVMAFVTLFVPEEFLNIPTHGSIQYHPSLLPAYRGASAINWPIIKGEKETGLSIFWPDNGLDTGDVLHAEEDADLGRPTRSAPSISTACSRWASRPCWNRVDLVKAGKAPRIKQDESKATYEGRCGPGNAKIDWGKPWEQIDRLIRGCNPAPGAWMHARRQDREDFRRQAAAGQGPQGHRRQARRDRRGREPTASPSSAPTAASRSRACSPTAPRRSTPPSSSRPPSSLPGRGSPDFTASKILNRRFTALRIQRKTSMPASQHQKPKSDIEIAQAAKKRPIMELAKEKLGIAAGKPRALRPLQGQGVDGLHQVAQGQAERQADPGHRRSRRRRPARARPPRRSASPTRSTTSARRRCCACASRRSGPASA